MKVVLVTGCSSGLGEALTKELFAQRRPDGSPLYTVYASARRIEDLSALEAAGISTVALDVTSGSSVQKAVAYILQQEKRIDVLVNNAGLARFGPIAEQPLDELDQMLDTNVMGVIRVTQAVVPRMADMGQGLIVNIGSVSAWLSTPFSGGYCASKAALHAFSDSLRLELRPFNISVTTVCAGAIKSSFSDNAKNSSGIEQYEDPDSLYQKFVPYIRQRITMSQTTKSVKTADVVAEQIVYRINHADQGSRLVVPSSFLAAGNAFFYFILGLIQKLFGKATDNLLASPFGL